MGRATYLCAETARVVPEVALGCEGRSKDPIRLLYGRQRCSATERQKGRTSSNCARSTIEAGL